MNKMEFRQTLWLGLLALPGLAFAQALPFPKAAHQDEASLATSIPDLARHALAQYQDGNRDQYLSTLSKLQWAAGQYAEAASTVQQWRAQHVTGEALNRSITVQLYLKSYARMSAEHVPFEESFRREFRATFAPLNDRAALDAEWFLQTPVAFAKSNLQATLERHRQDDSISLPDALELVQAYTASRASEEAAPLLQSLVAEDDAHRYLIQEDVLIKTPYGATLSAMTVRSKAVTSPQPTALFATAQTDPVSELYWAKYAATRGYVGVSSDTRGKRLSPDEIVLYEDDARDLYWVIDWISHQPWSNGKVGMWGGSESGFMTWAAAKTRHPALKTIVPYCPENPGYGLPMQNNVFLTANYASAFYLTDNKYLDEDTYNNRKRWNDLIWNWYHSGRPYREIDQLDGKPNKWLQRDLQHPSYDSYYQQMTAYREDFAHLNIPVLAIDGYYDDGQSFALLNLKEHYRYNPQAEHYLLIGPYDHFGTQSAYKPPALRGYGIDPVAQFDTSEVTFQWLDYVMRGGPKPALLTDRINYEVMGANLWRHAPSLEKSHNDVLTYYLTAQPSGPYHALSSQKPSRSEALEQTVDFRDRASVSAPTYPSQILSSKLDLATRAVDARVIEVPAGDPSSGPVFISEPIEEPVAVSGMFTASLDLVTNKKDLDIAMVLYEVTPQGQFFHLAYTVERASYAKDMSVRHLLEPGRLQTIPIERTLFVSRQLAKGSRLLVVLDVNKGPYAQVNYGTGKDVSDESVADAGEPLQVEWRNSSTVRVPIWR
jgi:putative CocE/NonD family hydrolase